MSPVVFHLLPCPSEIKLASPLTDRQQNFTILIWIINEYNFIFLFRGAWGYEPKYERVRADIERALTEVEVTGAAGRSSMYFAV